MPPITPPTNGDMYQHGLHHLLQNNSNASFQQEQIDEGIHLQSHYGSPTSPQDDYVYQTPQPRFRYQHQHTDSGLGIQYDGVKDERQGAMYHDQYIPPAASPPIPSEMLRTRSGLTIQRARTSPEVRARNEKSPKPKRTKKDKVKAEKKVVKLDRPLSELTRNWTHVPVVDIEAYVNRSAEERRKEVETGKVPGKVKRPMNSFMLYRKAYQNRTKDWCLQNNHQVVSQVCGDSWPLEPDEVKEQFSEWARIERINHQNAHPGYKFSPTKPGAGKPSKRKWSEEVSEVEESDLDDFEWRDGSTRRSKRDKHQRINKADLPPVVYPSTKSAYQYSRENSLEPQYGNYHRSSYQSTNPNQPLPMHYGQTSLHPGEYYAQSIYHNQNLGGTVEDIILKKAAPQQSAGMHSYLGMPGSQQGFDMMHGLPQFSHPQPEGRIDPNLMTQNHRSYPAQYSNESHHPQMYMGGTVHQNGHDKWQSPYATSEHDPTMPFLDPELNHEGAQIHDTHAHVLKGHQEGWHVESLDAGGEFDKWMDEE